MAKVNTEEVKSTVKKAAGAAKRATKKTSDTATAVAKKAAPQKAVVKVQYDGKEVDTASVVAEAKAIFKAEVGRVAVKTCEIYLKPEENAAYYVINNSFSGKIEL